MAHRVWWDESEIEMDAVDLGIGRQHVQRAAFRNDDGRVIARPDDNPRGHGQPRGDACNQRVLAEGGDRRVTQKRKAPLGRVWRSNEPAKAGGAAIYSRASGFLGSEACTTRDLAAHLG